MRGFNDRAQWFSRVRAVCERLNSGESAGISRIPFDQYSMASDKDQKYLLKSKLLDVLEAANVPLDRLIHCPVHDDHTPSLQYFHNKHGFHCYACHEGESQTWDMYDLLGLLFDITVFWEKRRWAERMLVEQGGGSRQRSSTSGSRSSGCRSRGKRAATSKGSGGQIRRKDVGWWAVKPNALESTSPKTSNTRIYKPFDTDPDCAAFLTSRGISAETASRFGLMWWEHPNNQDRYVVIPCEQRFVVRRRYQLVNGRADRWKYYSPSNPDKKPELSPRLFNARYLTVCGSNELIFIVESALDALLIEQMGFHAVSLNGLAGGVLLEKVDILQEKRLSLMLLLDNDKDTTGENRAFRIGIVLKDRGIRFGLNMYRKTGPGSFLSGFKDVGEAFVADADQTKRALKEIRGFYRYSIRRFKYVGWGIESSSRNL